MEIWEAKKELRSYKIFENTIIERRKWLDEKKLESNKLTSTLSNEPKSTKKENDTMAEKLTTTLDIETETEKYLSELEQKKLQVYKKILLIDQPYQDILFSLYIQGNTIEETAQLVHYSKVHTDRLKKEAIQMYANE